MASVSETIVREYFELHGFLVRQQHKYVSTKMPDAEEVDFHVQNPNPRASEAPQGYVMSTADVLRVERAVVGVCGSHMGNFTAAVLEGLPDIVRFVEPAVFRQAARFFSGTAPVKKILVLPSLPQSEETRSQTIDWLRGKGVDAVILFRTLLADLVAAIEPNRNYQKSDLLQVIRLLRHYDFIKEPQMELFRPKRRMVNQPSRHSGKKAEVDTPEHAGGAAQDES